MEPDLLDEQVSCTKPGTRGHPQYIAVIEFKMVTHNQLHKLGCDDILPG